jgi:hypothetical protein
MDLVQTSAALVLIDDTRTKLYPGDYYINNRSKRIHRWSGNSPKETTHKIIIAYYPTKMGCEKLELPLLPYPIARGSLPTAFKPDVYGCNGECGICDDTCEEPVIRRNANGFKEMRGTYYYKSN